MFLPKIMQQENIWISMIFTIVIVTFFLWFLEIQTTGGPKKKEKQIEIRADEYASPFALCSMAYKYQVNKN